MLHGDDQEGQFRPGGARERRAGAQWLEGSPHRGATVRRGRRARKLRDAAAAGLNSGWSIFHLRAETADVADVIERAARCKRVRRHRCRACRMTDSVPGRGDVAPADVITCTPWPIRSTISSMPPRRRWRWRSSRRGSPPSAPISRSRCGSRAWSTHLPCRTTSSRPRYSRLDRTSSMIDRVSRDPTPTLFLPFGAPGARRGRRELAARAALRGDAHAAMPRRWPTRATMEAFNARLAAGRARQQTKMRPPTQRPLKFCGSAHPRSRREKGMRHASYATLACTGNKWFPLTPVAALAPATSRTRRGEPRRSFTYPTLWVSGSLVHAPLIFAALMIGHHFSISAF